MPEPRDFGFVIRAKIDSDHSSNTITRASRAVFFFYINPTLVYWFSKKEDRIVSSTFGSELIAMK